MAEVWRTRDRRGRVVVLTEADLAHLRATVEIPHVSTRDAQYTSRACHDWRTAPYRLWLKVVVHHCPVPPQGTWAGQVITAYRTTKIVEDDDLWP